MDLRRDFVPTSPQSDRPAKPVHGSAVEPLGCLEAAPPLAGRARLFVIVDTEEQFDWSAPFSRDAVDVSAIDEVDRLQQVLGRYRITPTYVIDYPVATSKRSADRLAEFARRGECHIGAHLHPWVNPPHSEALSSFNSYGCNLGIELELEKIHRLRDAIDEHLGVTPRVYKAGRYGFGHTTAEVLEYLHFDVDASVNPHMDFTSDGGPSFEGIHASPAIFGRDRTLLELPCTTGFIGAARRLGDRLHRAAATGWLERFRAVGVLARTGTLNKVMLSPEGSTLDEMKALTADLYGDGLRTFSLTFHSPSLKPGCTPYVRTVQEREAFLRTIDQFCDFFCGKFGGVPDTPHGLYDELVRRPEDRPRRRRALPLSDTV